MPKHPKTLPARIKMISELGPGELQLNRDGELVLVGCPTCSTKSAPGLMTFLANVGSSGGEPFLCPACGYTGTVKDGTWRKS